MIQSNRLPSGGRIDRSRPLMFTYNGTRYQGYAGDTLASALLANGVSVVARSFKLHRPRGIVASWTEEPNAIVQVGREPVVRPDERATQVELYDGLEASTVIPTGFDLMALNDRLSGLLPAGFYYKTFMWPRSFWKQLYEKQIRNAAGLGHAPKEPDPERYDKMNAHADVLVVGGGPAGLAAALAAGRSGARVLLVDEHAEFGGSLLTHGQTVNGKPGADWVREVVAELQAMPEVRLLTRATALGHYDHNFVSVLEDKADHAGNPAKGSRLRKRLWRVRARQVVHATGAQERPLVFANNDRPGVMIASAVSTYVKRYAVAPGRKVVVFTNNDSAYRTALDLHAAGIQVVAVVDVRTEPSGALAQQVREAGIVVRDGAAVIDVKGQREVKAAVVDELSGGKLAGRQQTLECDLIAMSGGWSPVVHLHCHAGAKPVWDDGLAAYLPPQGQAGQRSAGAVTGASSLSDCLQQGLQAGAEAAAQAGFQLDAMPELAGPDEPAQMPIQPCWLVPHPKGVDRAPKQFVDYQNDTTAADIVLATREGYRNVQHVKRYTLMGFGTDQGKLGNINGMGILAQVLDQGIAETGTTTYRPVYTAVPFGALAGRASGDFLQPVRKTSIHEWHVENGAMFEDVGQWKRPWYFPKPGESMQDAVNRECLATRQHVGIMDASTLGKIEVHGKDASRFLDMIYTGDRMKMKGHTCRYGLMLHEDGMIFDDGVTAKFSNTHFFLTTTSGGAAGVMRWLERWHQTEWPEMEVFLTSTTDQWASIAINGPDARKVLGKLCDDVDLSQEAFPFMGVREGTVAGVPARLFRISFTGELAWEVHFEANYGRYMWEAIMEAGQEFGITPYGTETMHLLRAEKGFVIAGQDTDGTRTPADMGMQWAVGKKKQDFLGMRSLTRSDMLRSDRKELVGLLTRDPQTVLSEGAQLVNSDVPTDNPTYEHKVPMIGHVTSSYYSAVLGRSIALAVVRGGSKRHGEIICSPQPDGRVIEAEITSPVFYDPKGARQNV